MADLYHVHEVDAQDDNALLVRADDAKEAVKFWLDYYEYEPDPEMGYVAVHICMADPTVKGAIRWGETTGMFEVGRCKVEDWL